MKTTEMNSVEIHIANLEMWRRYLIFPGLFGTALFCVSIFGLPYWETPAFGAFLAFGSIFGAWLISKKILLLKSSSQT